MKSKHAPPVKKTPMKKTPKPPSYAEPYRPKKPNTSSSKKIKA